MRHTTARELAPGLVELVRADTGVRLWLVLRRRAGACYSYSEEQARRWYAEPA